MDTLEFFLLLDLPLFLRALILLTREFFFPPRFVAVFAAFFFEAAFLGAAFLDDPFLDAVFLEAAFLGAAFFEAAFLGAAFLEPAFLDAVFFDAAFAIFLFAVHKRHAYSALFNILCETSAMAERIKNPRFLRGLVSVFLVSMLYQKSFYNAACVGSDLYHIRAVGKPCCLPK
ncbi:MAG TPA: hypothetical protein VFR58_18750 [Flavisolibacter sp.]|nr:hypothetical protein [Flavisolibacter sp.]